MDHQGHPSPVLLIRVIFFYSFGLVTLVFCSISFLFLDIYFFLCCIFAWFLSVPSVYLTTPENFITLVSLFGCYNKNLIYELKQLRFFFKVLEAGGVSDQGTSRFCQMRPTSWFKDGHLHFCPHLAKGAVALSGVLFISVLIPIMRGIS